MNPMKDTEQLAGVWSCVAATVDGKPLPVETARLLKLTFSGNHYKTEKGDQVLFDSTYIVKPSATPKEISIVGTEGELAGKEAQGIYSLEGDTLTICHTMPGEPRPPRFESAAGSKAYLVVWQRVR